jgi:hypothetical protein
LEKYSSNTLSSRKALYANWFATTSLNHMKMLKSKPSKS